MTHKGQNPVYVKRRLARLIVESLHNAEKATCAEKHFDSIFKEKKTPEQVQEYKLDNSDIKAGKVWLVGLLVKCKLAASNGEARRLISQGAIKIGGNKVDDVNSEIDVNYVDGKVIQKGKRHFRRISIN
jgi:tyrosyl-tRNA synthetase